MSTKLATGLSKGEDTEKTAKEAVEQANEKLKEKRIDLSIVYSSTKYDYQKVVDVVRASTGDAPLIGCSSAGEFSEEEVGSGNVAVGLISSDEIKFFTAIAGGVREDPEAVVRSLANKLPAKIDGYPNLTAIFMVDGLANVGEEITVLASQVFNQVLGENVKIVGGAAGDDMQFKKTFVFSDNKVATDAASVCLLASKMPLFTGVKHGHTPLNKALKVTKARGNVLYEVNNRPAWEVWKEETAQAAQKRGINVEELEGFSAFQQFLGNYELGLPTEKEGEYKVRFFSSINDDGSLNFSCGITEGSVFRIMDGSNLEKQIEAAEEAAKAAKKSAENAGYSDFDGLLVLECGVRVLMLGDEFYKAVDGFKKVLPGIPLLGLETYGEICMDPGQFSGFHNTTSEYFD
jgi:methyl-accepting chemotaxis protein